MKKITTILGAMLAAAFIFLASSTYQAAAQNSAAAAAPGDAKTKAEQGVRAANDQFYAALNSMFAGNIEPMNAVWSHGDYVTDMGPFGGCLTGWAAVGGEFKKEAGMKLGGKIACKDVHVFAGTDMGYSVCVEEGENKAPDGKMVAVSHRATNVFHLENGQWKLVHHQTDISPQLEKAFAGGAK